ncbi:MAG: ATP-binding protein [Bacteroidota bacterium]
MSTDRLEELKKVIVLKDLPEEQLKWVSDHFEYKEYEDGELLIRTGQAMDKLWLISEGRAPFYLDVNGKLVHYFTFENAPGSGGAGGLLPYSRMTHAPGNTYAAGKVKSFWLHKDHFTEMERVSPLLIQRLIASMTERARAFATMKLQQEKIGALGQLSAGIAHELNNPAAAISRISEELDKKLNLNYELTEKMIEHHVNPEHIQTIYRLSFSKEAEPKIKQTATKRIQAEDAIADWLNEHGYKQNLLATDVFVESGFTKTDFENIFTNSGKEEFEYLSQWLENLLTSRQLIKDLGEASKRISNLVGAIKGHVHMDRSSEQQPTNIHNDIDNTLTLLGYKLSEKNIEVVKRYCGNLREVPAFIGELNQVWTNLIDNAIYAMDKGGTLTIETACGEKNIKVCVIDSGKGIPPEIVSRIFDPFFTTKKVGEGIGIGLNLVSRIIQNHDGEIKVNSVPGRTEFTVRIPFGGKEIPDTVTS